MKIIYLTICILLLTGCTQPMGGDIVSEDIATSTLAITTVEYKLIDKTAEEKATIKGQEIAKIKTVAKTTRTKYDIEIIDMKEIELGVEVFVRAWDKNGQIGFGKDGSVDIERFVIKNPPIMVADENGDYEIELKDHEGNFLRVEKYREDLQEAVLQVLEQTISVKTQIFDDSKIIEGKIGNTTLTVYPNAGTGTAPIDGNQAQYAEYEDWDGKHDGVGTTHNDTVTITYLILSTGGASSGNYDRLVRSGQGFDTSSIDTDAVDSATFSLRVDSIVSGGFGNTDIDLTSFSPANGADFANTDYAKSHYGTTRFATGINRDSLSTVAYNNWTLNASGKASINKSGNTFFGTRFAWDVDDAEPVWAATETYIGAFTADEAGTTKDPKLVVEHSVPPPVIGQNAIIGHTF